MRERTCEREREREQVLKKVITTAGCCNFKTSRCFRTLPSATPSTHRPTHPTLAPHGGSYPGESITDEGAHGTRVVAGQRIAGLGLGVARGAVELGSASGTRPARDRRRRHRRTSPHLTSSRHVSPHLTSPPRPPPLTRILCSLRWSLSLSLSLSFARPTMTLFSFRPRTVPDRRRPYHPLS